jgi:hypothetical protein
MKRVLNASGSLLTPLEWFFLAAIMLLLCFSPLPPVLSHLISKGRDTAVGSGNMLDINMPCEQLPGGCMEKV